MKIILANSLARPSDAGVAGPVAAIEIVVEYQVNQLEAAGHLSGGSSRLRGQQSVPC
jgi:hypothetical protein